VAYPDNFFEYLFFRPLRKSEQKEEI